MFGEIGETGDVFGAPSFNAPATAKANKNNPSLLASADNAITQIPDDDRAAAAIRNLLSDQELLRVSDGQQDLDNNVSEPDSVSEADSAIKTFDQAQSSARSSIEGILALYHEPIEERVGLLINVKKLLTTMSREITQIKEGNFLGYSLGVSENIEEFNTLMEFNVEDVAGKEVNKPFAQADMSLNLLDVVGQKVDSPSAEAAEEITADIRKNIEAEADISLQAQANIVRDADADLSVLKDRV